MFKLRLLGENILVCEKKKDLMVDGLLQKYDDNSPYMYASIAVASKLVEERLSVYGNIYDMIILFKRPAKIPVLGGYIVNYNDILAILSKEEYDRL